MIKPKQGQLKKTVESKSSKMKVLSSIFVLTVLVIHTQASCPAVITRTEWNARSSKGRIPTSSQTPVPYVVIHHAATPNCLDRTVCQNRVKSIQNYHQDHNGWVDIGYNFLVGGDGSIFEGRGWGKHGAHAPRYNAKSVGICFIGTFTSELPSSEALNAAKSLIECGVELGHIKPESEYKLIGHRQASTTECPGQRLYQEIQNWPRYVANPTK